MLAMVDNEQQRLEETFAKQMEDMESMYGGGTMIVSMPTVNSDTLQHQQHQQQHQHHDSQFAGSTRSSLSSYSEG